MPILVLPRPFYASRCRHSSVPSTSLCLQQHRRRSGAVSQRNSSLFGVTRDIVHLDAKLDYEHELGMVEQRRQEVFNQEFCSKNAVNLEQKRLDRLEDVLEFYYEAERLPKRHAVGQEGRLARWMNNQRKAKRYLDEGKTMYSQNDS